MNYNNLCYSCFFEKSAANKNCPKCGYSNSTPQLSGNCLRYGTLLNKRYIVGKALGVGGFGITYKCMDTVIGGVCAVKEYFPANFCMRSSSGATVSVAEPTLDRYNKIMKRFVEEGELLKTIHHRNIIQVYDSFFENNTAYYVMEYCDGIDLRNYTDQFRKRLEYNDGMNILFQTMNGLEYIHSKHVLHRDIAPDNIYVTKNNTVKILDFGSARYEMDQEYRNLSVIIKAGYAPVEQYGSREKQGPYTDIYALGATFYHLFTGRMPLESTQRVTDTDNLVPLSNLRPDLPDNLKYCIERSMSVRVSERISSIAEMKRILGLENVPSGGGSGSSGGGNSGSRNGGAGTSGGTAVREKPKVILPDNPSLRLSRASVSARVCAYMIDMILYGAIYSGLILLAVSDSDIALYIWSAFPVIFMLINMFSEILTGSTAGKAVMRLCVRDKRGQAPNPSQIILRNMIKLLGIFNIIFIRQEDMLDDRWSDSRVYSKK